MPTTTHPKPVYSIFQPRTKPPPPASPPLPAEVSSASDAPVEAVAQQPQIATSADTPATTSSTTVERSLSTTRTAAAIDGALGELNGGGAPSAGDTQPQPTQTEAPQAQVPATSSNASQPKKLKQAKLRAADCDLTVSDADDAPSGASATSTASRVARPRKQTKRRAAGKASKKVATSSEEEVIVVSSSPKKGAAVRSRRQGGSSSVAGSSRSADSEPDKRQTATTLKVKLKAPADKKKETEVIEILDSPPPKSPVKLPPTLSAMRPLGELTRSFRDPKRPAVPTIEVRWPTREEHEHRIAPVAGPSKVVRSGRWNDAKGKARAEDDEAADSSVLASLRRELFSSLGAQTPPAFTAAHTFHSFNTLFALLPSFPPHPLLDRLARPLREPSSSKAAFIRGDRKDDSLFQGVDPSRWRDAFTVKYAPKRADEVLGTLNRRSATELKAWLEELAIVSARDEDVVLGGGRKKADASANAKTKRRPIERGVKQRKRRKRRGSVDSDDSDLEGFIARDSDSDDDLPPDPVEGAEDDDDDSLLPQASASRRAVFPFLTNLILLHGPSGSGKTSAVHAVASELGWQVFEVWPGVGKRTARDLEKYVGDVSKNHTLRGGGAGQKKGSIFSMFEKKKPAPEDAGGVEEEGLKPKEVGREKQSVILIDEVDVLFKEEKDFWQGLVSLALSSQRPIVLTCTDTSLVPFEDLALQPVVHNNERSSLLSFAPPEPSLAVPFLQLVALSEGHIFPREDIERLYEKEAMQEALPLWYGMGPSDGPVRPRRVDEAPVGGYDLRRALVELQFRTAWEDAKSDGVGEGQTEWIVHGSEADKTSMDVDADESSSSAALARMALAADSISFADAHLARRPRIALHHFEPEHLPSAAADDLIEFDTIEMLPPPAELSTRLPGAGREDEFATALDSLARNAQVGSVARSAAVAHSELLALRDKRTERLAALYQLGDTLHPYRLAGPSSFTDYLPFAQAITHADDVRETALAVAAINAAVSSSNKSSTVNGALASSSAPVSRSGSGATGGSGASRRRSGRLQGLKPYQHRIGWRGEEGEVVRALSMLK